MAEDKREGKKREGPVYINMGTDKEILQRLEQPLRKRAKTKFQQIYPAGVPSPSFGKFLGFCISLGLDHLDRAPKKRAAASPAVE